MISKVCITQLADNRTLQPGESLDLPSEAMILKEHRFMGYWSLELQIHSGGGMITAKSVCSNSNENYRVPSNAADICTNFSSSDGELNDGVDFFPIDLGLVPGYLQIRFLESSGTNPVTFSAWLSYTTGK
jgi:hypothetical protein